VDCEDAPEACHITCEGGSHATCSGNCSTESC
jgi:hypothetical protein